MDLVVWNGRKMKPFPVSCKVSRVNTGNKRTMRLDVLIGNVDPGMSLFGSEEEMTELAMAILAHSKSFKSAVIRASVKSREGRN